MEIFHCDDQPSRTELRRLAQTLRDASPQKISFIDHFPLPADVIRALDEVWDARPSPRVAIHVFGDFSIHPGAWLEAEGALRRFPPLFIGASEKQVRLLESWVHAPGSLAWIPFPVDTDFFSPGPLPMRDRQTPEVEAFTYAGRLSLQKNVLSLLRAFGAYVSQINPQARLSLAGPFDDMGIPYLGKEMPTGLYEHDVIRLIEDSLPSPIASRVEYLGDLSAEALRDLYRRTDVYASWSTHNDEDFGMAPAEALATGCAAALTDWGGYTSFRHVRRNDGTSACEFLPVKIEALGVAPSALHGVKTLARAASRAVQGGESERASIAASARALFSIDAVSRQLMDTLDAPREFVGFTPLFRRVVAAFRLNPTAPYATATGYSSLYREVYAAYL